MHTFLAAVQEQGGLSAFFLILPASMSHFFLQKHLHTYVVYYAIV